MRLSRLIINVIIAVIGFTKSYSQTEIPLYKNIPNSIAADVKEKIDSSNLKRIRISSVINPTLTVYLPEKSKANGTAVIICPGGGYSYLVINNEGRDVAKELNKKGVAAFVLKYRLPNNKIMQNKEIGPLQDAQQAIKIVRERAREWNVDTAKVGIMGFSAGGHLASTASVKFENAVIANENNTNLRPDFSILVYPVISFTDSLVHKGSRNNLLGENSPAEKIIAYSGELQVTAKTPPAFIMHCSDDKVVPVKNSVKYYEALLKNGVKAELHIYSAGGHGFGLYNSTTKDNWLERCFNWMEATKIL
ncbi:MAG: endo,4-beta-xylanase [Segetibacter sp.]|nr:endo,4-beta-xylanase [Segetibacter sp.]